MSIKKDISTKEDVAVLVESFYQRLVNDSNIGIFFTEVVPVNFKLHLPKMINFWESVLFATGRYKGNPMIKHMEVDSLKNIEDHHFVEWLKIWRETVNIHFSGEIADQAIKKAESIGELMKYKVSQNRQYYL